MPMLKNAKQEMFAQAIVAGKSQREAYRSAGYAASDKSMDANASQLAHNVKVSARIEELRTLQTSAAETILSKAWVIQETIDLQRKAKAAGAYGPATKCMELLGREVLAFIERKEIGLPGDFSDLSDAELVEIVRGAKTGTGASRTRRTGTGETPDPKEVRSESDRVH